ncbi:putative transmembrane protein [Toxoplasma gondii TgCatPRC2]|uniref:Putative transmembrane protein n=1 Tax=Toxoplasma gondii TgCatPRC2 TaxID=1130821 RepID=A0A151HS48_TOXGO|nr:putative transmembrane protein [Toxoplasma gondii TgCatPRC2]
MRLKSSKAIIRQVPFCLTSREKPRRAVRVDKKGEASAVEDLKRRLGVSMECLESFSWHTFLALRVQKPFFSFFFVRERESKAFFLPSAVQLNSSSFSGPRLAVATVSGLQGRLCHRLVARRPFISPFLDFFYFLKSFGLRLPLFCPSLLLSWGTGLCAGLRVVFFQPPLQKKTGFSAFKKGPPSSHLRGCKGS